MSETSDHVNSQEESPDPKTDETLDIDVVQYEEARQALSLEIVHLLLKQMQNRFGRSVRTKHCKSHFFTAVRANVYLAHFNIKVTNETLPFMTQLKNATEDQFCKEQILRLQLSSNVETIDLTQMVFVKLLQQEFFDRMEDACEHISRFWMDLAND